MWRPLLVVYVVALTACGGSDATPADTAPADPVAAICEQIRTETQAMLNADTFNERMDAINESKVINMVEAAELTGADIRARCPADVDRNLAAAAEIVADPYDLD